MSTQQEIVRNSHCQFFLVKKKRFCRMVAKKNHKFCGEHEPPSKEELPKSRIICPLDNTHTCYIHKLKHHLKICNARRDVVPPYIQYGINNEDFESIETDNYKRNLKNVDPDHLAKLILKIETVYADIGDQVVDLKAHHEVLEDELGNPEYGNETRRHLLQTSAILGLLKNYNLLESQTCFVEFGGGKGKLSVWLSKATKDLSGTAILLIDRASHRHKQDNKCRDHVTRIKADIQDLVLKNVDIVAKSKNVVGLAKHLCGSATDLALKCLENLENMKGLAFAFCCHHRCQWGSYKGKAFFSKVGLSKEDFDAMCGLVSWAVCGHVEERKVEIGRKCKMILDWGRLLYIQERGYKCVLHRYVPSEMSLENICILGYKE